MNPEQMLTRAALSQGATTYKNDEELQNSQLQMLSQQLRALMHQRHRYKWDTRILITIGPAFVP